MPTYQFCCNHGHQMEKYVSLQDYDNPQSCYCGETTYRQILAPALVKAQPECRYDSPIDGRPITTWQQREEDLARHNCQPYDPEQKKDYEQKQAESQSALEKALDETVEEKISRMPTKDRERLHSELVDQGADIVIERKSSGGV